MREKLGVVSAPCSIQAGWDFLIRSSFPFSSSAFVPLCALKYEFNLESVLYSGPLPKIIVRNADKKK